MDPHGTVITISSKNDDLAPLLDLFDEHLRSFPTDFGPVKARAAPTSYLSAGLPEVSDLIVALGSSGAFAALYHIFREYFKARPTSEVTIEKRDGKQVTKIIMKNVGSREVEAFFKKGGTL